MPTINDDETLRNDWEEIRRMGLRALREDLEVARCGQLSGLDMTDRIAGLQRRMTLLETAQFISLKDA